MAFNLDIIAAPQVEEASFESNFINRCSFADLGLERENVKDALQDAVARKLSLHVLSDDENDNLYGFVALRLSSMYGESSIVIDFLYTSADHRKAQFKDLNDGKVSDYLVNYSIQTAHEISETIPVTFVALKPIDEKLIGFYGRHGFRFALDDIWQVIKIS